MSATARQLMRHVERHATGLFVTWLYRTDVYSINGDYLNSIMTTLMTDPFVRHCWLDLGGYCALENDTRLSRGRTMQVEAFLACPNQPEWFLSLDPDMTFDADAIRQLMAVADPITRPIVGALAFAGKRPEDCYPTLMVLRDSPDGAVVERVESWPEGAVVNVDATGAAFLLVHRRVFEAMAARYPRPYPWFAETVLGGADIGEDYTFCLRARQMGIPVSVHTGVEVGHVKVGELNRGTWEAQRRLAPQALPEGADSVGDGLVPAGGR